MFWLFSDFYTKAYNQKKRQQQQSTTEGKVVNNQVMDNGSSVVDTPNRRSSPRLRTASTTPATQETTAN